MILETRMKVIAIIMIAMRTKGFGLQQILKHLENGESLLNFL